MNSRFVCGTLFLCLLATGVHAETQAPAPWQPKRLR